MSNYSITLTVDTVLELSLPVICDVAEEPKFNNPTCAMPESELDLHNLFMYVFSSVIYLFSFFFLFGSRFPNPQFVFL